MFTNENIVDDFEDYNAADSSGEAYKSLENDAQSVLSNGLEYAGVDAQYFASALLSNAPKENDQSPAAQKARKLSLIHI